MKTKNIYIKPEIEEIEVMLEGTIMNGSDPDSLGFSSTEHEGAAGSRQRNFWD